MTQVQALECLASIPPHTSRNEKMKLIKSLAIAAISIFASIASAAEVQQTGHGAWDVATGTTPDYWAEKGMWLDVEVENIAYDKEVGIVWTDNNWTTANTSYLSYEFTKSNGNEQWGIDFAPLGKLESYYIGSWQNYETGTTRAGGTSVTIKYAVFYNVNGNTYWDNNSGQDYELLISL